jgi:hypothetical protein
VRWPTPDGRAVPARGGELILHVAVVGDIRISVLPELLSAEQGSWIPLLLFIASLGQAAAGRNPTVGRARQRARRACRHALAVCEDARLNGNGVSIYPRTNDTKDHDVALHVD